MENVIEYREYLTAWSVYLGGCAILIGVGCLWTRGIRNDYLRSIVRLLASTVLLLPVQHEDNAAVLVPAVVVVFLGAFIGNTVAAVKAMNIMVFAGVVALVLAAALVKVMHKYRGKRAAAESPPVSPEATEVAPSEIVRNGSKT